VGDRVLHLHRLEDAHDVTGLDLLPLLDENLFDSPRLEDFHPLWPVAADSGPAGGYRVVVPVSHK
jgi:hypothetical protein